MEESINIGAAIARAARKLVEMSAHWGEFDNIEFTRFAVQTLLAVEPRAAGLPDDEMINVVEWVVWWATRIHARRVPLRLVD